VKKQKIRKRTILCGLLTVVLFGTSACVKPEKTIGDATPIQTATTAPAIIHTYDNMNTEPVSINTYDAGITPHGATILGNAAVLDGETIYALTGATVTFVNAATGIAEKTITLAGLEPHMTDPCLFVNDGVITVLRANFTRADGEFALPEAGTSPRTLVQYDLDGALLHEYDISGIGPYFVTPKLIVDGGAAYILAREYENVIFKLDFATETLTQLDIPLIGDMELAASGELLLISDVHRSMDKKIYCYNTATQTVLWEKETIYAFNSLAVDTSTGMCYLRINEEIYAFQYGKMESDVVSLGNLTYEGSHSSALFAFSFFAGGDKLVLFERSGALKVCGNASGNWVVGDKVLYMLCQTGYSITDLEKEAVSIMNDRYPGFRLVLVDGGSDYEFSNDGRTATRTNLYTLNLTNKMLANDTDFDLFFPGTFGSMNILLTGYFEDLSQYPGIVKNFDEMLPGVKGLCTFNGKIYGLPSERFSLFGLEYSQAEMEALGVTVPGLLPTMDEYEAMMMPVLGKMAEARRDIGAVYVSPALQNFTAEFLAAPNPDKAELTTFFEKAKSLCDKGLMHIEYDAPTGIFDRNWSVRLENADTLLMGVPRLHEDSGYTVSAGGMMANHAAANKALAIEFMEVISSKECLERYYDASIQTARRWNSRGLSDLELELDHGFQYLYTRETLENTGSIRYEFHKEMLANSIFDYNPDPDFVLDRFQMYAKGEITLEAAVDAVYSRLMMIKNE